LAHLAHEVDGLRHQASTTTALHRAAVDAVADVSCSLRDVGFKACSVNDSVGGALLVANELGSVVDGCLEALGPDAAVRLLNGLDRIKETLSLVASQNAATEVGAVQLTERSNQLVASAAAATSARDQLESTLTRSIAAVSKRADNAEVALSWTSGYLRAVIDERTKWQERYGVNPVQLPELQHFHELCRKALGKLEARTERAPSEHADRTVERFVHRSLEGQSRYVPVSEELALLRSVLNQARVQTAGMTHTDIATLYGPAVTRAVGSMREGLRGMKAEVMKVSELMAADFESAVAAVATLKSMKRGPGSPRSRRGGDTPKSLGSTANSDGGSAGVSPTNQPRRQSATGAGGAAGVGRRRFKPMCMHTGTQTDRTAFESDVAMPGEPIEPTGLLLASAKQDSLGTAGEADNGAHGKLGLDDRDFWGDEDSNQDEVLFRRYNPNTNRAGSATSLSTDGGARHAAPRPPRVQPRGQQPEASARHSPHDTAVAAAAAAVAAGTGSSPYCGHLSTTQQQLNVPRRMPSAAGNGIERLNAKVASALARAKQLEEQSSVLEAGQRAVFAIPTPLVAPVVVRPPAVPQHDRNRSRNVATANAKARSGNGRDLEPQQREHFEGWLAGRGAL
jgi:hypothetical protein